MTELDALLTARQLGELLRVDRTTIYRMLKDGQLKCFKVGGQWRFSRQAVEHWLRERQANCHKPSRYQRRTRFRSSEASPGVVK